jgi:hypothetical protein
MMENDLQELQAQGANARALGRSELDNPFLKSAAMPAATGDAVEHWNAKAEAWALGWKIEDAMRHD